MKDNNSQLEGNEIHSVKFGGCYVENRSLTINFYNDSGNFEHTISELSKEDFKRSSKQPSKVESMMLLLKHLIDAIAPELAEKIDTGKEEFLATDWPSFTKLVQKTLNPYIGVETKIKLIKDEAGKAIFPESFAALNREGKAYIRNNFIGERIAFTPCEINEFRREELQVNEIDIDLLEFEIFA